MEKQEDMQDEKENINNDSCGGHDDGDERDGVCGRMGAGLHRLVVGQW